MRYCVADRYRQAINAEWLNEQYSNGRLNLIYDTYESAKNYLRQCFFDDSDYAVFGYMGNGMWIRCFSETRQEIVR